MLGTWRRHTQFQDFLVRELRSRWTSDRSRIDFYAAEIESAYRLDLDPAKPILALHYSTMGRPSNQAPEVLRSLILMTCAGHTSIPRWHDQILAEPILAIACGFEPGHVPAVSSFYYLCDLLWPADTGPALRRTKKRPKSRPKGSEKLPPKHGGIVHRLLEQAQNGRRLDHRPERALQEILARVVVDVSASQGLLGDPERMAVALDGAPLETGASPFGKRICACSDPCDCRRRFQDGHANWGWDSFHKRWFYGHTLYHVTAADSLHDLPLYVRLPQASRHDSCTGFVSLVETIDLYPNFTLRRTLADSAHDNAPTYTFCYAEKIAPYIDANPRRKGKPALEPAAGFTSLGAPICSAGEVLYSNGYNPGRRRHKWRCPRACGECACSSSDYGRVVYTYPDGAACEPPVPRESEAWKKAYKRRTTVERSLKRALVDRTLEACRVRRRHHWYWRAILCAIAQHLDAWIEHGRAQGREPLAWLKPTAAT